MMMQIDDKKLNQRNANILRSFNETVDQLQGFSFWKSFPSKSGINITWDYTESGVKVNSKIFGPDDESISAFILKYRLFIQNKDDISLGNMDRIYSKMNLDKEYYDKFKSYRQSINDILDKPSNVQLNKHVVSIREIHDMFIYGVWVHRDEKDLNRKKYLSIKDNPVIYPMFANDFNVTLVMIMNELVNIKFLNDSIIKLLEEQ